MEGPSDAVAAVVHADPYPYYAGLVAERPLHYDPRLGLWVAAGASAVTDTLTHPACRVRPFAEPVPAAIASSGAGTIYGAMVRFNDGAGHALKATIARVLGALDAADLLERSRRMARLLADELRPHESRAALREFMVRLAPSVTASMLGAPPEQLGDVARWTSAFVSATAPGASPDALRDGAAAAGHLLDHGREWATRDGVLGTFVRDASAEDHERIVANGLGLLWQSYDATGALIGNTLVALGRMPALRTEYELVRVVAEVARHDAPVQNTRRFLADDSVVAGHPMKRGDAVLVVLAAANRDPAANPDAERLDPRRAAPQLFTFGHGPHACPGATVATSIATAGVDAVLSLGVDPATLAREVRYRPSASIRMPLF